MKDLFIEEKPEIEKKASEEMGSMMLPQDATKWTEEIISIFLQHYPNLHKQPVSVTWRKKNPDEGYGIGYVNVLNGAVPVIIQEYRLAPMDILYTSDGTAMPLHNEFIQELMSDPTAFSGLRQSGKKSTEQLFNSAMQFSPITEYGSGNQQNGKTRDAVKVASVIDNISYVHRDDAIRLLNELKDGNVKEAFEKNGTLDYFKKVAEKAKGHTKQAQLDDYLRDLDIDRQMVYEDEYGNKFVKQANSKVDKTWETRIDEDDYHSIDKVLANNETRPEEEKITKTAEFSQKLPEQGDYGKLIADGFESDEFEVIDTEKVAEREKVASFDVYGQEDKEIRISDNKEWEITEKNASFESNLGDLEGSKPKVGDTGVFVCNGQATKPIEITKMSKTANQGRQWVIKGDAGLEKFAFYPLKTGQEFEAHENGRPNHVYVPKEAKFVKVAEKNDGLAAVREFEADLKINGLLGFNKVAFYGSKDVDEVQQLETGENGYIFPINGSYFENKDAEEQEKTANLNIFKAHEVHRDRQGLYNLRGPQFAKYAQSHPIRNLDETDAKWAALHCGATEEDLAKIASLAPNREVELNGKMNAPTTLTKVDEKLDELHNGFEKEGRLKIAADLVKQASFIRDKRAVDAVLSLSLLRKRNVQEYVAVLPTYEAVLAELSKLLIASRMGLANTNPGAIKDAVTAMAKVVIQLTNLKSALKDVD